MKLRPYPEYKDSGVPWLGEVPIEWKVDRLKTSVAKVVNGIWGEDPRGVNDIICVRVANFDRNALRVNLKNPTMRSITEKERKNRLLKVGDLLLEKSGGGDLQPVGAVALYNHEHSAVCSNFIARMEPREGFSSRFLTYLHSFLYSLRVNLRSIKQTTGIQNLDASLYLSEKVAFPPSQEQTQIARFLDWKTAQIDRFIDKKRRLIELLKEQKQALINQAVTGAIDVRTGKPYPEYKDSGVPWLGKVPAGWEIRKFKYLARFSSGGTPSKSVDSYWDGELPWISPKDMKDKEIRDAEDHISEQAVQDSATGIAKPGDLLIVVRSGILRRTIPIGIVKRELSFNQDVKAISPKQNTIFSDYLLYLINGCNVLLREEWVKVGATVESIEHELMANSYLPVPSLEEQGQIADYCQRIENSIRKVITRTQREIALIQEYRRRLIADVVTGKLDVRGVEVPSFKQTTKVDTDTNETEIPACEQEAMA